MNLRTKAAFWLSMTFLTGALLGGGLTFLWRDQTQRADSSTERKPPTPEEVVAHLNREAKLELDAEQVRKLQEIFRQRGEQMAAEAHRSQEEIRRIRAEAHEQIRTVLSPEQFGRFEQFKKEWRERRHRKEPTGG